MIDATNLNLNISNEIALKLDHQDNNLNKSNLRIYSPTIQLTGHKGEIYSGKFSNEGYLYSTAGHDRIIMLWEVYEETCRNITTLTGHTNAILDLVWAQDDSKIYSASADKTVSVWDIYEAKRVKKFRGHDSFVNCLDATRKGPELVI